MALGDVTPSRSGQVNLGGADDALFLKVFSGTTLVAFEKTQQFKSRHYIRAIEYGKSASFPAVGRTTAAYHTPGTLLTGTSIPHAETVINVDGLLLAHTTVASIDELKNHFDVRDIYANELGQALAQQFDRNVAVVGVNAARASNVVTSLPGGTVLTSAATDYKTDSDKLLGGIFAAAQALDEKDVPNVDRTCFLLPAQYYLLGQNTKVLSRDFNRKEGTLNDASIAPIAGIDIVKTNNLPTTNITTGVQSVYNGDFTKTAALIMQKAAVGTVRLKDITSEVAQLPTHRAFLMVAEYAMGHGILRPNCAVELKTTL